MSNNTKRLTIGGVAIGGGAPVSIQSMLCAPPHDREANLIQARELEEAGCQILRVAIPDRESLRLIPALKEGTGLPVVADIHFDYRLAVESAAAGADKIRINPGNIGGEDRVGQVAEACRAAGIPIRIGVNTGSLDRDILAAHGGPTPQALVESALRQAAMLERFDFGDIVISLKSSDVWGTIAANRLIAERCDYPLHLGVTEAGTERMGLIKSAVGIGSLLLDGIGDTLRVSLSDRPVREIAAAKDILKAIGLGEGPVVISCPTCGRCQIDIFTLARQVEEAIARENITEKLTVAVMGCGVNGPGEAAHADVGVAGGDGCGLIFAAGKVIEKIPQDEIVDALMERIRTAVKTKGEI